MGRQPADRGGGREQVVWRGWAAHRRRRGEAMSGRGEVILKLGGGSGCWSCLLVAGCWLLVAGCWLLVAGCWLLVAGLAGIADWQAHAEGEPMRRRARPERARACGSQGSVIQTYTAPPPSPTTALLPRPNSRRKCAPALGGYTAVIAKFYLCARVFEREETRRHVEAARRSRKTAGGKRA